MNENSHRICDALEMVRRTRSLYVLQRAYKAWAELHTTALIYLRRQSTTDKGGMLGTGTGVLSWVEHTNGLYNTKGSALKHTYM